MKSYLKKLRGFAFHKNDSKEKRDRQSPAQLDELAQASQDMQDMRNCYDSLLSAAAATANSAFEFSESSREMGACLLEKTSLIDYEDSGRVLLMLGKVQYELQKLVDSYVGPDCIRSHIFQTITNPSESLLSELRTVEEMKHQCDEKRNIYEYMVAAHREKGKSSGVKGDSFSAQQLQTAREEYDNEATFFVFRLKSLRQGQSRSLLTQAARHHAAQLTFFRRGLKSLEAVEPHVKLVTEQQHIDYQFNGLEDDDTEGRYEDDGSDANYDGELSFDYGQNVRGKDVVSTARNSVELDQVGDIFPPVITVENAQENLDKIQRNLYSGAREPRAGSHSAPILPDRKFDVSERISELRPSRKFRTYVLPTPVDAKNATLAGSSNPNPGSRQSRDNQETIKRQSFSGPLTGKQWSNKANLSASGPIASLEHPLLVSGMLSLVPVSQPAASHKVSPCSSPPLMPSPKINELHELPRPPVGLAKPTSPSYLIAHSMSLVSKSQELSTTAKFSSRGTHAASPLPTPPGPMPRSFFMTHAASPLPTPPGPMPRSFSLPSSSQKAPSKSQELSTTAKFSSRGTHAASPLPTPPGPMPRSFFMTHAASPLPTPPGPMPRSFSLPSSSQKAQALQSTKFLEATPCSDMTEEVASPPLTPLKPFP